MKHYMRLSAVMFCITAISGVFGFMALIVGVCIILVLPTAGLNGLQLVCFGLVGLLIAWLAYRRMLALDAAMFDMPASDTDQVERPN